MTLQPHNHLMRVVIGIYTGREDNIFWRRVPGAEGGKIETVGVRCLGAGDAVVLEEDVIHSVTNPLMRPSGAIHVYAATSLASAAANGTRKHYSNDHSISTTKCDGSRR